MKKKNTLRVKLIINPGAGDALEEGEKIKFVTDYLEKNGLKVKVVLAKPKEEATPIVKRAIKQGYKFIIAMGGDGTIEAVVRGMVNSKARLGIIPVGTQNNVAKSLGIPIDLEQACALIVSKNTQQLDVGQIKVKKGKKFYFFELATVGLSAAIYPDANKVASGKLSSLKDTAKTFFEHETKPKVYLTINNESKVEINTMLVVVSNTPIFGKNFLVAPEASLQDGLLDISIYPDFSKAELVRYYAQVMDGGYSGDKKVQNYQARKLKIKTSPKLDVMADGIVLESGKVKIKVLPAALRVISNLSIPSIEGLKKSEAEALPRQRSHAAEQNQQEETAIKVG